MKPCNHPLAWSAVLLAWLMLPNALWLAADPGPTTVVCALSVPLGLLTLLAALLGRRPAWAVWAVAPAAVLAPLEAYYVATYRHPSNAEILATLAATNLHESWEYGGRSLVGLAASMLAGALLVGVTAHAFRRSGWTWSHRSRFLVLLVAALLPAGVFAAAALAQSGSTSSRLQAGSIAVRSMAAPLESGYPFGVAVRVADYAHQVAQMRANVARRAAFRFQAHKTDPVSPRRVVVLVIGESSRRNRWQLFGADRPTNPELSDTPNLVPLTDMVSPWSASILAIPVLLTRKPGTDAKLVWEEPSILRPMAEAGFETFWLSNQMAMGKYDSPVSVYALEAQHTVFFNRASWTGAGSYDETLLGPLRDAIAQHTGDLFIVLHTMGSHGSYDFRYPPAYKHFRPTLDDAPGGNEFARTQNSYDNTILYTDHVLARIIDVLKESDTTSALWYQSDHGEDLPTPTCELKNHGNGSPYDFEVPAFVWYSDAYAQRFPDVVAALRAHATQKASSTNVFESLVTLAGVVFPSHDPTMSLLTSAWKERARPVTGLWPTDYDRAPHSARCNLLMPVK